jgi:hypothetical protein
VFVTLATFQDERLALKDLHPESILYARLTFAVFQDEISTLKDVAPVNM